MCLVLPPLVPRIPISTNKHNILIQLLGTEPPHTDNRDDGTQSTKLPRLLGHSGEESQSSCCCCRWVALGHGTAAWLHIRSAHVQYRPSDRHSKIPGGSGRRFTARSPICGFTTQGPSIWRALQPVGIRITPGVIPVFTARAAFLLLTSRCGSGEQCLTEAHQKTWGHDPQ
jgi:hypothetical protein